jgi:hypothetical protein
MGGFFVPPQFLPVEPPLFNDTDGKVLTMVGGRRKWAMPGSGGGASIGPLQTYVATAGANNNVPALANIGRLDVDTTAGAANITGIAAGFDGQLLIVRCIGANPKYLTLNSMNAGSSAANQLQLPADLTLPQYDGILLCYYGGPINKWCLG